MDRVTALGIRIELPIQPCSLEKVKYLQPQAFAVQEDHTMTKKEDKKEQDQRIEHVTHRIEEYESLLKQEPENKEFQLALKKFKAEREKLMGE